MNIFIDARATQNEVKSNGLGKYTLRVILGLIQKYPNDTFYLCMYDSSSTLDAYLDQKKYLNVRIVRCGKYDDKGGLGMILYNLKNFFRIPLIKAVLSMPVKDYVMLYPYFNNGILPLKKSAVVIHDFAMPVFNNYSDISPFHNFLRKIFYWWNMQWVIFANRIIVDAQYTISDIKRFAPFLGTKPIDVVYLYGDIEIKEVDISKYLPKDWKDRGYIIYLGAGVTKNKNSIGVIRGYIELSKKYENSKKMPYLIVAGRMFVRENEPTVIQMQKEAKEAGLEENVLYIGGYEDIERYSLYKNALAFIHLSLYEGFGYALVEGMYSKVPLVAHRGTTYIEIVGNGGLLVDGLDEKEVGDALFTLITDKKVRDDMVEKNYIQSKKFTMENNIEGTYNSLVRLVKN